MKKEKIDFVITWVDGNDKNWLNQKNKYNYGKIDSGNNNIRYRDWEQLKYWFRGVEMYANWVNKIYFVTCGQIPDWLNVDNPKLVLVDHKDFIPLKYLPTFSSHTIELNLHRINGLSDKFVYFNDDVFIINKVNEVDFFENGFPKDDYIENVLYSYGTNDFFPFIMMNDCELINKYYKKRIVIMNNIFKFLNFRYGFINNIKNLFMLSCDKFSSFSVSHLSSSFLKSTFNEVWAKEYNLLDKTCSHKFRTKEDVNQYVFKFWQYCNYNFIPRKVSFGKNLKITNNNSNIEKSILGCKYKVICINDSDCIENFELQKKIINDAFEKKFPNPCSFEKQ